MAIKQSSKNTIALPRDSGEAERFVKRFPGLVTEVAERCGVRTGTVSLVLHGKRASKRISQEALIVAQERINGASMAQKN